MSKQRYIQDSFWTDPYIEQLKPKEKLVFLYYLTNPLCNIAGIYEVRDSRVSYELGIPEKEVSKIKNRLVKDKKILTKDDWIILKNFAKHQSINPNVREGMQRIINSLPSDIKALEGFESLSHFTLLNLTYIPAFSGEKGGVLLKNNKKDMKTFNLDTGEYEEDKPKTNKSKEVIALANLFDKMVFEELGVKINTPKSYFIVINAMKQHGLKPKGVQKIYQDWFANEKIKKEDKVKLSWCLGKDNINSFKVRYK